jgi:two-component sensor histidine kinase
MLNIEAAIRGVRDATLNALVGGGADRFVGTSGLSLAARVALTLLAIASATVAWDAMRAEGILGAASFYFPAILIVTLFAGWELGIGALAASTTLIWALAQPSLPGTRLAVFALAGFVQVLLASLVRGLLRHTKRTERTLRDIADRREREADTRELALGEARHRLKNLMAIIEALAKFSGPRPGVEPAVDKFMQGFLGRLRALGTASDLVLKHGPDVLEANAVIHAVLEPFLSEAPPRLRAEGPSIELSEEFGGALALAVHELATNALKYGALSVPTGSVAFHWTATPQKDGEHIEFEWKEIGGPTPSPPAKDGFGHRLIRAVAAREPGGQVLIDYPAQGLVCRISFVRRSIREQPPAQR